MKADSLNALEKLAPLFDGQVILPARSPLHRCDQSVEPRDQKNPCGGSSVRW